MYTLNNIQFKTYFSSNSIKDINKTENGKDLKNDWIPGYMETNKYGLKYVDLYCREKITAVLTNADNVELFDAKFSIWKYSLYLHFS